MRDKLLPILLSAFMVLFGFGLGSTVTKLNIGKSKPQETEKPKSTEVEQPKPTETQQPEYETYTVAQGDTLFSIAIKFNISMDELAKLNGIVDPNQLKAGQVLKIPKTGAIALGGTKIEIDLEKMKEVQVLVDQGNQTWRLDPIEVTKTDAPASYEFTALDSYSLKSKDVVKGEAVVEVKKTKDSKIITYEVNLIQPTAKGEKGIWAISSIKAI